MVEFAYLWDSPSGLLAINVNIDGDWPNDECLLIVEGMDSAGGHDVVAVCPLRQCDQDIGSTVVVTVPIGSRTAQQFDVRVESGKSSGQGVFAQDVITLDPLFEDVDEVPTGSETTKWSVCLADDGPYLSILGGEDEADENVLSQIYMSARSGNCVLPAKTGARFGRGARLEFGIADPEQDDGFRDGFEPAIDPLYVDCAHAANTAGPETQIRANVLLAGGHVRRLLDGEVAEVSNDWAAQTKVVRGTSPQSLRFPVVDLTEAEIDKKKTYSPSLLDRLVVTSRPAATLVLRDDQDNKVEFGRDGIGVLAFDAEQKLHVDNGALLDRLLEAREAVPAGDEVDFVSELARHGYNLSPADTRDRNDVMSFLYASVGKRLNATHRAAGGAMRPASFADYAEAAQFYCALAETSATQLPRRAGMALKRAKTAPVRDRFDVLATQILKAYIEERRVHYAGEVGFERLAGWVGSPSPGGWGRVAAAYSEAVRDLVQNGVSPETEFVSPDHARDEREDAEQFGDLLTVLTKAGLCPDGHLASFEDLPDEMQRLEALKSKAILAVRELSTHVDGAHLFEGVNDEDAVLDMVAQEDGAPTSRGARYLVEQLAKSIADDQTGTAVSKFTERGGVLLFRQVEADFRVIEAIAASSRIDPVQLTSDEEDLARGRQLAESQAALNGTPLSETHKAWLLSEEPVAPLIAKWRAFLRANIPLS